MSGYHPCMHDAFHHAHLPLPRPTGPYTVIRTTQLVTSNDPLVLLGPQIDTATGLWSNITGWSIVDDTKPWSDANNSRRLAFDSMNNASWSAAQVTPAAFSAQIMNPGALQTTSGIVYAGRLRTAFKVRDRRGTTGKANAVQFISYNNPRLLAAAKLAFRGVQVDNVPFNMSELANFTEFTAYSNDALEGLGATGADFAGFAPQFIYNPQKIDLQLLVCCEWRVRFNPSNPAQASHIQHTHAPESFWMRCLHTAEAMGNGVIDIADRVAETGNAVFNASAGAYRAGRGLKALTSGSYLALGA